MTIYFIQQLKLSTQKSWVVYCEQGSKGDTDSLTYLKYVYKQILYQLFLSCKVSSKSVYQQANL